jgi:hypothetical protein
MGRTKKVSPSPAVKTTTVLDRIRAAEKSLLTGATARVLISETDLENVASLIYDTGSTQAQILKKAVHLGLQVLKMGTPTEATTAVHEEAYEEEPYLYTNIGGWKKMDPIPYAGFLPAESASHYLKDVPEAKEDLSAARAVEDLETQF